MKDGESVIFDFKPPYSSIITWKYNGEIRASVFDKGKRVTDIILAPDKLNEFIENFIGDPVGHVYAFDGKLLGVTWNSKPRSTFVISDRKDLFHIFPTSKNWDELTKWDITYTPTFKVD